MKKTLLTTTAIIAAFVATDAQANSLQVNIGGFADFQAGYTTDDVVDATAGANETQFNTDSEIHVSVEGAADNGLEYGAVLELEANVGTTTDKYNDGDNADKAYLFVQGGWGRVELGENTGAEEALSVNTSDFASATGGVGGDFYRYASPAPAIAGANPGGSAGEISSPAFAGLTKPLLALAEGGATATTGANEDATKVTYYSPRFAGFQAGVSYTANSDDTARTGVASTATTGFENVFSGGVNYTTQFDQVGVSASLTGLTGDDKLGAADLEGWAAGANVTFAGFTAGGSYGDYLDTFGNGVDANYYDLGLGYVAGPFSVSATYFNSEVEQVLTGPVSGDFTASAGGDFENIVVGADYQLAPGLVPYAEVSFYEYDTAGATVAGGTGGNDGTAIILGTELSF